MLIDIICPATQKPIKEFSFDDDIWAITRQHMNECHPDWAVTIHDNFYKIGAADCPLCGQPAVNAKGVDKHVTHAHPGYRKEAELYYVFDQELFDEHQSRHCASPTQSYFRVS